MKKLAVKRFPEKLMMAIIILSCGFVLHSEPSAHQAKKAASGKAKHKQPQVTRSHHQQKDTASPPLWALLSPR